MQSCFFDAVNYDRTYNSADFVRYFASFVSNGVFADPASSMQVYSKGGMEFGVKEGKCWINGRIGYADGEDSVTLNFGEESVCRYDAIVARLDLKARDIHIDVIQGDDASSLAEAVKPEPTRTADKYDLILAYVAVGEGASSLTDTAITDARTDETVCGIVAGLIDQIDTSALFAQYEAQWALLKAACEQDADAVIKAWEQLVTVTSVNDKAPSNGNVALTQSDIPSDGVAYQMPFYVQSGTMTVGKSALDGIDITFPRAFKTAPLVIFGASVNPSYAKYPTAASYNNLTNEGFTLVAVRLGSSGASTIPDASPCIVNWVALGPVEV